MSFQEEIIELHQFFQDYFRGQNIDISRFSNAISDRFTIVTPNGTLLQKKEIIEIIKKNHGSDDTIEIMIEDMELLKETREIVLAKYVEVQRKNHKVTRRVSTVVFDKLNDGSLKWLHVHETWLKP